MVKSRTNWTLCISLFCRLNCCKIINDNIKKLRLFLLWFHHALQEQHCLQGFVSLRHSKKLFLLLTIPPLLQFPKLYGEHQNGIKHHKKTHHQSNHQYFQHHYRELNQNRLLLQYRYAATQQYRIKMRKQLIFRKFIRLTSSRYIIN